MVVHGSKISFMITNLNILLVAKTCMDRYEYVAVESMEKATQVIIEIARLAVAIIFN